MPWPLPLALRRVGGVNRVLRRLFPETGLSLVSLSSKELSVLVDVLPSRRACKAKAIVRNTSWPPLNGTPSLRRARTAPLSATHTACCSSLPVGRIDAARRLLRGRSRAFCAFHKCAPSQGRGKRRRTENRAAARGAARLLPDSVSRVPSIVARSLSPPRHRRDAGPLNALDVVTTTDDMPAVVIAHPLLHRKKKVEPFPTTYWLAHNGIAAAVATVERDGGVSAAGAAVDSDAMARAHAAYAADRWALLDDEERAFVQDRGWDSLRTVGVAGIRDGGTKCLHAHYAHFLATRANPVGEWVHARLPEAIQRLCPPSARAKDE